PEGVTNNVDKEIQLQHKRTIGIAEDSVWVSNEFSGARMNDFYKVGNALYRIVIEPERHPINNSPWYAFKVWSNTPKTIHLQLTYKHGDHRYRPRLSKDREHWYPIDADNINTDTSGRATLTLDLDEEPLWVSAQELITSKNMQQWADSIANNTSALLDTIGQSHQQRPILKLTIGKAPSDQRQGVLVITSRQHPPEVTGEIASKEFIETLLEDDKLAQEFRQQFEVWAYPIVNPDGVDLGQWRNNAGGNDLNRDWKNFNQPETKSIHDDLAPLADNENRKVFYGIDFHSTGANNFYPINREVSTFPEDFTYHWIDRLRKEMPNAQFRVEPFPPNSPIAKNWIYHFFGADAVTYEVDDNADRSQTREIARNTANIIMDMLLDTQKQLNP